MIFLKRNFEGEKIFGGKKEKWQLERVSVLREASPVQGKSRRVWKQVQWKWRGQTEDALGCRQRFIWARNTGGWLGGSEDEASGADWQAGPGEVRALEEGS